MASRYVAAAFAAMLGAVPAAARQCTAYEVPDATLPAGPSCRTGAPVCLAMAWRRGDGAAVPLTQAPPPAAARDRLAVAVLEQHAAVAGATSGAREYAMTQRSFAPGGWRGVAGTVGAPGALAA